MSASASTAGFSASSASDRIARAVAPLPDVGERRKRPRQIIVRRQQRLRDIGAGARGDCDAPALPALVEQRDGAGRALVGDDDARDIVAQFDRQVEFRRRPSRAAPKSNGASPMVRPLASSARSTPFGRPLGVGAQHARLQRAGEIVDAGEPKGAGLVGQHGRAAVLGEPGEAPREGAGAAKLQTVGDP